MNTKFREIANTPDVVKTAIGILDWYFSSKVYFDNRFGVRKWFGEFTRRFETDPVIRFDFKRITETLNENLIVTHTTGNIYVYDKDKKYYLHAKVEYAVMASDKEGSYVDTSILAVMPKNNVPSHVIQVTTDLLPDGFSKNPYYIQYEAEMLSELMLTLKDMTEYRSNNHLIPSKPYRRTLDVCEFIESNGVPNAA